MRAENFRIAVELRRELHQNAEKSNHEMWTRQRLMAFLREKTHLEVIDRGNWFYAVYRAGEGKRNIAFRADFDAIMMDESISIPHASNNPGISHKCGHDGHAASLAGFALEVDQNGADSNIYFLFQHAEETGDGAKECVALIREENIDEIFAYHNMSGMELHSINVINGTSNFASRGMTIQMTGAPSHASQPELGRNPAYAIAKVIDAIPAWTESDDNAGDVLCTVIQVDVGERAFGISASRGALLLTIRAEYENELDRLQEKIESLSSEMAGKFGLEVEFSFNDVFPETSNHKESSDKIREVGEALGMKVVEMPEGFRGSEDFGYYLKETKGAICYIGNGADYEPLHTYGYDFPDEIIKTAVSLFKGLAGIA